MSNNLTLVFRAGLLFTVLVVLYLTTTPKEYELAQNVNDKLSHAMAFFALSFLADFSFPREKFTVIKIIPLVAYGVLIECIQSFLPYRSFSLLDIVGDAAGIALYLLCLPLVMKVPGLRQRMLKT